MKDVYKRQSLALPADYGYTHVDREMLPIIPATFKLIVRTVKTSDGTKPDPVALKQLEVLRKLFQQCDKIVVATDCLLYTSRCV